MRYSVRIFRLLHTRTAPRGLGRRFDPNLAREVLSVRALAETAHGRLPDFHDASDAERMQMLYETVAERFTHSSGARHTLGSNWLLFFVWEGCPSVRTYPRSRDTRCQWVFAGVQSVILSADAACISRGNSRKTCWALRPCSDGSMVSMTTGIYLIRIRKFSRLRRMGAYRALKSYRRIVGC